MSLLHHFQHLYGLHILLSKTVHQSHYRLSFDIKDTDIIFGGVTVLRKESLEAVKVLQEQEKPLELQSLLEHTTSVQSLGDVLGDVT